MPHALKDDRPFRRSPPEQGVLYLRGILPIESSGALCLDQIPGLLPDALDRVHHHAGASHQPRRKLGHLRVESAHRGDEDVVRDLFGQHRLVAGRGGNYQAHFVERLLRTVHDPSVHPQAPCVLCKGVGPFGGTGGQQDFRDAETFVESLQVGASLGPGANDEERPVGTPGQGVGGEQRECGGALGGDGGAVEDAEPRSRPRLHHDYLALDGGQFTPRVPWMDGYQLGDRQLVVRGGHYQKIAAFGQGQDEPGGSIQLPLPPSIHSLPDGVCQLGVGQAGSGLSRVEDLHRYSRTASRSVGWRVEPSMARCASIPLTTITSYITVRSSILFSRRCLPLVAGPTQAGGFFLTYDVVPLTVARQGDVVDLAGPLDRDEAVGNIADYLGGIPLTLVAETPAAWQVQEDPLSCGNALLTLGMQGFPVGDTHRSCPSRRASLYTLGRATSTIVHGREGPGRVAAHPELHLLAEAAAVAAGAL